MSAYRVVSTFEERGIRPPSKESVTVGETDLKFIHLRDGQDTGLLQYVRNGGIAFPHIMIPEVLQLRKTAHTSGSVLKDAVGSDSIVRRQTEQQSSDSESTARQDEGQARTKSALSTMASHALWLWNAKENASDLINYMQTRSLLVAESWLPGPLASAVFGQVPGTASAARADAMEVEEEEGKRNMLAKSEGPISCIAWHPHRSLVAIAHRASNTIFLYDMGSGTWCPNVLQNAYMQGITSMAWQPNCGYTLAVGCSTGVCLWGIIPSANAQPSANPLSAPSLGSMQFSSWMTLMAFPPLAAQYQYPSRLAHADKTAFHRSSASVSALTFSPSGQWLITGHQSHGHLTVWDVALGTATPLKRSGSSSRSAALQVEISPNGRHLVSTHANGQLRLWETESWTSRVWSDFHGNISRFAWSPDSRSLFFAVGKSSEIYALALYKPAPSLDAEITVASSFLAHATATSDGSEDSERIRVGGAIKSLALDSKGQRLVVGFDDDSASSDISLLAVYLVNSQALFRAGGDTSALMPLGYIRGPNWGKQHPQEATSAAELSTPPVAKQDKATNKKRVRLGLPIPSWFGFAPNFEPGALLTVAWANGKVTFVPMLFRNSRFSS
ncbi:hypothetical protein LPJ66_003216 [Kickxella alabastrina]|uniref:Uncharacterized protein n=1 Tax=Kickxella alabastrina TaxID=61397 RepID=A0ACC1ILC1_9FUNG|nr:hypothetical protein LPJ66_003216 [Kickxella alabastrina]